jgi:hypothetical protein
MVEKRGPIMREKIAASGERAETALPQTLEPALDRGGSLASQFKALSDQWRRDTLHTSSLTKMITHPSYLRIIGMGQSVLPLLFRELEVRPDHWLVALNAITGVDPAPAGSNFDEAVNAWLDWDRRQGYLT